MLGYIGDVCDLGGYRVISGISGDIGDTGGV